MRSNGIKKCGGSNWALPTALFCLAALGLASCNQQIDTLGIKLSLEKHTLSNGLTVIFVEDHTVPIISYQTWYRVGSLDEQPGATGISHLFEHLMFKGTPKYGPKQFFLQLEAKGAEVNAYTTRDYTVYYENFVPELLDRVVDMEADRMQNLLLDDDILNSERMVVLEERRLRTDNAPEGRMQEALWQLAYRVHPYQWPVIGYPQDLLSLQLSQVTAYFKAHYQPANATLVIVGDFKPASALATIQKFYSSVLAQPRPKRALPTEPDQQEERRLVMHDHVASERFARAYHVTSAEQDDSYTLDVLANILFEGSNSRAYKKLVDEKDLASGISGSAYTPTYPGLFIVTATMKGGLPAARGEEELDRVIAELQKNGVTPEEVTIAVRQLTVQLVDSVRTPYGLGQLIGTVQTIFGDPQRFAEDLSKYLKVTASDVQKAAVKYLQPNNRSVVVLAPQAITKPSKKAAPDEENL